MIPYYIAFHYSNDLGMNEEAAYYYKIASMQDDAPKSTKFLGPIAYANTRDPFE
jgi:TPR repeat protein